MARRNVPFLPNNYYHVYNRGASKGVIFRDDRDYRFLLKQFPRRLCEFNISIIAYCLMSNHYHLLLRQNGDRTISDFMQAVFGVYSLAFNSVHERSGTLFEGPFRAVLVDSNEYLLQLCRYIHRNPVDAGMVLKPEQWLYSNYREFVGLRSGALVDRNFVLTNFGTPHEYREFVENYVPPEKTQNVLRHYLFEF